MSTEIDFVTRLSIDPGDRVVALYSYFFKEGRGDVSDPFDSLQSSIRSGNIYGFVEPWIGGVVRVFEGDYDEYDGLGKKKLDMSRNDGVLRFIRKETLEFIQNEYNFCGKKSKEEIPSKDMNQKYGLGMFLTIPNFRDDDDIPSARQPMRDLRYEYGDYAFAWAIWQMAFDMNPKMLRKRKKANWWEKNPHCISYKELREGFDRLRDEIRNGTDTVDENKFRKHLDAFMDVIQPIVWFCGVNNISIQADRPRDWDGDNYERAKELAEFTLGELALFKKGEKDEGTENQQ